MAEFAELKKQAEALEAAGKAREALGLYRMAIREIEGTPSLARELALLAKVGDLLEHLEDHAEACDAWEYAGRHYAQHGSAQSVIALCTKIHRTDPSRTIVYPRLAQIMVERDHLAGGREVLLKYTERAEAKRATDVLAKLEGADEDALRAGLVKVVDAVLKAEATRARRRAEEETTPAAAPEPPPSDDLEIVRGGATELEAAVGTPLAPSDEPDFEITRGAVIEPEPEPAPPPAPSAPEPEPEPEPPVPSYRASDFMPPPLGAQEPTIAPEPAAPPPPRTPPPPPPRRPSRPSAPRMSQPVIVAAPERPAALLIGIGVAVGLVLGIVLSQLGIVPRFLGSEGPSGAGPAAAAPLAPMDTAALADSAPADSALPPPAAVRDTPSTVPPARPPADATPPARPFVVEDPIAVDGLTIARVVPYQASGQSGYRVFQPMGNGDTLELIVLPLTDPAVLAVPEVAPAATGATGQVAYRGMHVAARAPVPPDSLRALLRRLGGGAN